MRIIPKKTKVVMEFFKGVEIPDVAVGLVGIMIVVSVLFSNLPFRYGLSLIMAVLTAVLVVPVDGEKTYMMVYGFLKYAARHKVFRKEPEKKIPPLSDITPFTGIDGNFIEYGGRYWGIAVEIPDVEFRFYTLQRQNQMIDQMFGSVLRTISGSESAALVKLERPVLYDRYLLTEEKKIQELKEAYINGLLNEDELTSRVEIVYERMEQIHVINEQNKVYVPCYYMVFFSDDRDMLMNQARNMIDTMRSGEMECHILSEKELAVFLKYNYTMDFDEREINSVSRENYMDWILPDEIRLSGRTVKFETKK